MIVTLTPHPAVDLTYVLDAPPGLAAAVLDVPPGLTGAHASPHPVAQPRAGGRLTGSEVHRAGRCVVEAGGKGVNVARWLRRRGHDTVAVLPLGGTTGELLAGLLRGEGVPACLTDQETPTRINTCVLGPSGPRLKVNAPGTLTSAEAGHLLDTVDTVLRDVPAAPTPWLAVCGSLPAGTPDGFLGELVDLAHRRGARVAVDTSGPALAAALEAGADLLAPTAAELGEVCPEVAQVCPEVAQVCPEVAQVCPEVAQVRREVAQVPAAALLRLLVEPVAACARRHGSALLVSAGAFGAVWTDGRRSALATAPAVAVRNTVGAGDVLLAAWLAADGLPGEARDPLRRLEHAVREATAACLVSGTIDATDRDGRTP